MRAAVFQHRLAKTGTAFAVAQRINLEIQIQPELAAQFIDHYHQLGVGGGVGAAENLDSELRELAKTALLRALPPEHRTDIVKALLGIAAIHPGFDVGAHHAGRPFRPQRQRGLGLVAVDERVHLLFHDVGSLAAGMLEEFEPLEHRNTDFADVMALDHFAGAFLDRGESTRLRAGRILKSSKSCQLHGEPVSFSENPTQITRRKDAAGTFNSARGLASLRMTSSCMRSHRESSHAG